MKNPTFRKFALAASALLISIALVGCEPKGPMEKAGEGVDNAGKDIKNAVDPRGPMEKAGDKVDDAVGK